MRRWRRQKLPSLVSKPWPRMGSSSDRPIGVEVDATTLGELENGQSVTVARGDKTSRFATFGRQRFPHTLQHKLGLDGG